MDLHFEYGEKTIQELVLLFESGRLNLEPGFQRESVWTAKDRKKLIETIIQKYPMPSVFLYKRGDDDGNLKYDVIDGKQRLESILMFQGVGKFKRARFSVQAKINPIEGTEEWDWKKMLRQRCQQNITGYKIPVVELTGELANIVELFVLINSTGKKLAGAELRNARYYRSEFLKKVRRLSDRFKDYFIQNRILSRGQITRMKHIELCCELVASISSGQMMNKKKSLDSIIGGETVNGKQLINCSQEFVRTLNRVKIMFPNLKSTRFANAVDFYSLFMLVWEMEKQHCILTDAKRNQQAEKLLIWLSNGVGQVRQQNRKIESIEPSQRLFADYLLTIQGDTDSLATRQRRLELLRHVLGNLFEKKDSQRSFTVEQRRLIWNSSDQKRCVKCGVLLTWDNFTIDHVKSHANGGRTTISNAALMCRKHNSAKGAKPSLHKSRLTLKIRSRLTR